MPCAEDLEHATHALNFDDTSPRGNLVDVSHAEDLEHAFRAEHLQHATHALNFDDTSPRRATARGVAHFGPACAAARPHA